MNWAKRSIFRRLIALLLLIGLWECTSKLFPGWPSAIQVGGILWRNLQDVEFQTAVIGSMRRMAIGYVLVVVLGISAGMILGRIRLLDELMGSATVAVQAIPGAAWVPLSIVWFGLTERAVIFTIVLGAAGIADLIRD